MNTTDERMMILKMIEAGTITAEEGAKLLAATGASETATKKNIVPRAQGDPRWFRVRVTDTATGRRKATVNLPISLMDWGLRVGAQFAPEMEGLDLGELSDILRSGAEGKIVEVIDEEDGEHVEIFIE
jgi:hypothetical protein